MDTDTVLREVEEQIEHPLKEALEKLDAAEAEQVEQLAQTRASKRRITKTLAGLNGQPVRKRAKRNNGPPLETLQRTRTAMKKLGEATVPAISEEMQVHTTTAYSA